MWLVPVWSTEFAEVENLECLWSSKSEAKNTSKQQNLSLKTNQTTKHLKMCKQDTYPIFEYFADTSYAFNGLSNPITA